MRQRILTAIVLAVVAIPVCIFSGMVVFPFAMAFVGLMGVYELLGCMKTRRNPYIALPLYVIATVLPFLIRYEREAMLSGGKLMLLGLLYGLYMLAFWVFSYQKNPKIDMKPILSSVFISLYIIGATSSIMIVRDSEFGQYSWYFIFIGAWVTDIFAYFTGMLFGKRKLIPMVSPKKTVEGSIGGTVFCIACFVAYAAVLNYYVGSNLNLLVVMFAGLLAAIVSQIGDLAMSVIKRTYGIKDYGIIFPGHGGVLDRFDSILAVAIVIALFLG